VDHDEKRGKLQQNTVLTFIFYLSGPSTLLTFIFYLFGPSTLLTFIFYLSGPSTLLTFIFYLSGPSTLLTFICYLSGPSLTYNILFKRNLTDLWKSFISACSRKSPNKITENISFIKLHFLWKGNSLSAHKN
jgi:hypothetical protein